MHNYFVFNGTSSRTLNLNIEQVPAMNRPSRKFDRYSVPGRNGDIFVLQDAWENVDQSYNIWGGSSAINAATDVGYVLTAWLFAAPKNSVLTDSYDTDHFRLATFLGPIDFENRFTRRGRATVTFSCDPRRFLNSGTTAVTLSATGTIENPTAFTARPLITVHGSGSATITAGGNTMTIAGIVDGMTLDCEAQDAYDGSTNLNSLISGSFPVIPSGEQTITLTGGITSIEVVPNWWTL